MANKLYGKINIAKQYLPESLLGRFNLPESPTELANQLAVYLLEPYTELINSLSQGDEEASEPAEKYQSCIDAFESYYYFLCNDSRLLVALVKGLTFITGYQQELNSMCHSVFYNYKGEESNVVPDTAITISLNPQTTGVLPVAGTVNCRKKYEEGQVVIETPEGRYDCTGKSLR